MALETDTIDKGTIPDVRPARPKTLSERIFHKGVNILGGLSVSGRNNSPSYFNQAKPLYKLRPALSGPQAQNALAAGIAGDAPFMAGRFGNTELQALTRYQIRHGGNSTEATLFKLAGHGPLDWTPTTKFGLINNAGFFPVQDGMVERFCEMMINDLPDVDLLASWAIHEGVFRHKLEHAAICHLDHLEPFHYPNPWSASLAGKRVLVIHPFVETIRQQFEKHQLLFKDPNVLPDMDLQVMASVQSIGGQATGYDNWFDALDAMSDAALSRDFDVAIIGCGAYGFPLACRIKRAGRTAIHMGGATQLLFGIRGRRWDERPEMQKLYNEHWVRPSKDETPSQAKNVEGGCYW